MGFSPIFRLERPHDVQNKWHDTRHKCDYIGELFRYHEEFLSLQPTFSSKYFDNFMLKSRRFRWVQIFLNTKHMPKRIEKGHSIERVWYSASRVPSDTHHGSQPCTQKHSIYSYVLLGFQVSLSARSTSLRKSLGWSNQRGSKTSHACYSHPRYNLSNVSETD